MSKQLIGCLLFFLGVTFGGKIRYIVIVILMNTVSYFRCCGRKDKCSRRNSGEGRGYRISGHRSRTPNPESQILNPESQVPVQNHEKFGKVFLAGKNVGQKFCWLKFLLPTIILVDIFWPQKMG